MSQSRCEGNGTVQHGMAVPPSRHLQTLLKLYECWGDAGGSHFKDNLAQTSWSVTPVWGTRICKEQPDAIRPYYHVQKERKRLSLRPVQYSTVSTQYVRRYSTEQENRTQRSVSVHLVECSNLCCSGLSQYTVSRALINTAQSDIFVKYFDRVLPGYSSKCVPVVMWSWQSRVSWEVESNPSGGGISFQCFIIIISKKKLKLGSPEKRNQDCWVVFHKTWLWDFLLFRRWRWQCCCFELCRCVDLQVDNNVLEECTVSIVKEDDGDYFSASLIYRSTYESTQRHNPEANIVKT
jgi:hypothetical protein